MPQMKRHFPLAALLVLASASAFSQKYSNEFLALGVSARAQALGGAQAAWVNDVTAGYWNPAGLTQITAPYQASAMHAEWFAGVAQFDYLAVGKSLNREKGSFLAVSLLRFGVDNIPYTINLLNADGTVNYNNLTQFSAADYALLGSYAQKLRNPAWSVGGTVKIVHRIIGDIGQSWGFGTDAGIQYRKGRWQLGLMGRDLTTTFNAWSFTLTDKEKQVFSQTGNEIPESNLEITRPRFVLGAAYALIIKEKSKLTAALDWEFTTDGQRNVLLSSKALNADPRIGLEWEYKQVLALRAGLNNFQRQKKAFEGDSESLVFQPNFGLGLRFGRLHLDYALTNIGNVSQAAYSHIFSLKLDWKESAPALPN